MTGFSLKIKMNSTNKILKDHGLEKDGPANKFLRDEVDRLCDPYVPMQSGNLKRLKTYPSNHEIKYISNYAHYMYKGKKAVGPSRPKGVKRTISNQLLKYSGAPKRGAEWDKRMMNDKRKQVVKDVENFIKKRRKMMASKMEKIKEWIETCPLLDGNKINVDYLEEDVYSYSIDKTPTQPQIEKFIDGTGGKYQITFDFTIQLPLSPAIIDNLTNSQFGEDLMDWVEAQNMLGNLPDIDGAFSIECTSPNYVLQKTQTTAMYIVQMNFTYYKLINAG